MTITQALEKLKDLEHTLLAYYQAIGCLNYDGETVAPKNSAPARGETLGVLGGVVHGLITAPETGEIIDTLLSGGEEVSLMDRRRAEVLKEDRDELTRVPADEYMAYQQLLAEAGAVWREAKLSSDFDAFAPYLEKIVDYNRRLGERKDPSRPAYDVLLDTYEKGASMAMLEPFFDQVRKALTPVVHEIAQCPQPDAPFLHGIYPVHEQKVFTDRVMALMGISRDDCAVGETEHPFTDGSNKHDVRITTHYHEDMVLSNLYSVIHEGGHALYELGIGDDLQGTVLASGSSMGIHESQSRFYENLIGRSLPFCEVLLPLMRECFPRQTEGLDVDTLYRCVNIARPSLIRTEADELTYPMHVMVRYELEKCLMSGYLKVRDVPGAWNDMYREYLGIEVPDHRRGCLQDSHWSGGMIGYFPGYALGSAYGAQMLKVMERDVDVWGGVRRGDLSPVTGWLGEKIHHYGQLLTPAQLLQSACGAPFDPKFYTDYLIDKYSALYGLRR